VQFQWPPVNVGHNPFGGKQQAENQRQGGERQYGNAEILDRTEYGRRQQYCPDQPAGARQRVEETKIQADGLEHGLSQDQGVQQRRAPARHQRAALGQGDAAAGASQSQCQQTAREQIEQGGQAADDRVHGGFRTVISSCSNHGMERRRLEAR